jgi:general stress protein 26
LSCSSISAAFTSSPNESSTIGTGLERVAESQKLLADSQNNLVSVVQEEGYKARRAMWEEGDKARWTAWDEGERTRLQTERLAKHQRLETLVDQQQVKEEQAMNARCNANNQMAEFYDRQVLDIQKEISSTEYYGITDLGYDF